MRLEVPHETHLGRQSRLGQVLDPEPHADDGLDAGTERIDPLTHGVEDCCDDVGILTVERDDLDSEDTEEALQRLPFMEQLVQ